MEQVVVIVRLGIGSVEKNRVLDVRIGIGSVEKNRVLDDEATGLLEERVTEMLGVTMIGLLDGG